jgi:DNA repair exonuclease SbcCD ATPase subunit
MNRMSVANALRSLVGNTGTAVLDAVGKVRSIDMSMPRQGAVRIAGELVQLNDKGLNPYAYYDRVSFVKSYFPDKTMKVGGGLVITIDENILEKLRVLFQNVFGNTTTPFNPENPKPPCDDEESAFVRYGLTNRFRTLSDEIIMIQNIEHDKEMLRTKIKQLSQLKELIMMLESNAERDLCNDYTKENEINLGSEAGAEQLLNALRKFIMFYMQKESKVKVADDKGVQYSNNDEIIELLKREPGIKAEDISKFVAKWRVENRLELPSLLIQILTMTGDKTDLVDEGSKKKLDDVTAAIKREVEKRLAQITAMDGGGDTDNINSQLGGGIIDKYKAQLANAVKQTNPVEFLTSLVTTLFTVISEQEAENSRIQSQYKQQIQRCEEQTAAFKKCNRDLVRTQEELVALQNDRVSDLELIGNLKGSEAQKAAVAASLEASYRDSSTEVSSIVAELTKERIDLAKQLKEARNAQTTSADKLAVANSSLTKIMDDYNMVKNELIQMSESNASLQTLNQSFLKLFSGLESNNTALLTQINMLQSDISKYPVLSESLLKIKQNAGLAAGAPAAAPAPAAPAAAPAAAAAAGGGLEDNTTIQAGGTISEIQAEIAKYSSEIEGMKAEMDLAKAQASFQGDKANSYLNQLIELQGRYSTTINGYLTAMSQKDTASTTKDNNIAVLERQLASLEDTCKSAQCDAADSYSVQVQNCLNEKLSILSQKALVDKQIAELKGNVSASEKQNDSLKETHKQEIAARQTENQLLTNKLNQLDQETKEIISNLEKTNKLLQNKYRLLSKAHKKLRSNNLISVAAAASKSAFPKFPPHPSPTSRKPARPTSPPTSPSAMPAPPPIRPASPPASPSAMPASPPIRPASPPASPSAMPAPPPIRPVSPSAMPASPSIRPTSPPASPSAMPAPPPIRPVSPSAMPASPSARSVSPSARPASPSAKTAQPASPKGTQAQGHARYAQAQARYTQTQSQ